MRSEGKGTEPSPRPVGERARVRGAVKRARSLRRTQTDAERKLWSKLRDRRLQGAKFRRQHSIGRYIVDFCCPEGGLVVELDGSQHGERVEADNERSAFLGAQGCRVLRFWDNEVLVDTDGVLEAIRRGLADPHPSPLPVKGRGGQVIKVPGRKRGEARSLEAEGGERRSLEEGGGEVRSPEGSGGLERRGRKEGNDSVGGEESSSG